MTDDPPAYRCAHCGQPIDGYATVDNQIVCHPNESGRPDCYRMITVYQHRLVDCNVGCQQGVTPWWTQHRS